MVLLLFVTIFQNGKATKPVLQYLMLNVTASDFPFNLFSFYFSLTKGLLAILLSTGFFILSTFTHEYYHDKEREGKTGFSTLKSKKYQNAFSGFFLLSDPQLLVFCFIQAQEMRRTSVLYV